MHEPAPGAYAQFHPRLIGETAQPGVWKGAPVRTLPNVESGAMAEVYFPHATLLWTIAGRHEVRRRSAAGVERYACETGRVEVVAAGSAVREAQWVGRASAMVVEFDPQCDPLRERELGLPRAVAEYDHRIFSNDAPLLGLLRNMLAETESGSPSGALYGESLFLGLAAYVSAHYAADAGHGRRRAVLSSVQRKHVTEFIEEHLGSDLTCGGLAGAAGVSARHFARLFRNTYGVTPHQYVLARRIREARRRLHSATSISEIALELGFSSHSHFTSVFRRLTGATPQQVRREARRGFPPPSAAERELGQVASGRAPPGGAAA